ncbi:hypothetical protein NQP46_31635 [Streptomyces albus]|nr:hypothetical protein NQP46_31635 [Streptomyces albus]
MTQVTDHLGGHRQLVTWLDRFPGLPRLTARLYVLMGLLDRYSEDRPVIDALRESRARTPVPPGLQGHVVPDTGPDTLAGLSYEVEELLGDGEPRKAVDLARATAEWLREVAPRAGELDHRYADLGEVMEHSEKDIEEAAAEL